MPMKFVFGSAAKTLTSFTALAKTEKKSDFATSLVEEEKDQSSPFEAKTANAGLTVTETPQRTGEEDEITKVALRARLFEYDVDSKDWKDRGPGLVKVNVEKESGKARLLMRADGILRVILNIRLFEGMDYSIPTERSIRFTAVVESRPTQFLLRCRSAEELCAVLVELDLYCSHYDEAIAEK